MCRPICICHDIYRVFCNLSEVCMWLHFSPSVNDFGINAFLQLYIYYSFIHVLKGTCIKVTHAKFSLYGKHVHNSVNMLQIGPSLLQETYRNVVKPTFMVTWKIILIYFIKIIRPKMGGNINLSYVCIAVSFFIIRTFFKRNLAPKSLNAYLFSNGKNVHNSVKTCLLDRSIVTTGHYSEVTNPIFTVTLKMTLTFFQGHWRKMGWNTKLRYLCITVSWIHPLYMVLEEFCIKGTQLGPLFPYYVENCYNYAR